jgi:hypothetical protein
VRERAKEKRERERETERERKRDTLMKERSAHVADHITDTLRENGD